MLKRRRRGNGARIAPVAGWVLLGLFVALLVGVLVARAMVLSYLESREFQQMLSRKTSAFLGVEGEFQAVRVTGTELYSDGFRGEGGERSPVESIAASQIRTEVQLGGVLEGEWRIGELTAQRVDLTIGPRAGSEEARAPASTNDTRSGWLPSRVALDAAKCEELNLRWEESTGGKGSLTGSRVVAEKQGTGGWALRGAGGALRLGDIPEADVERFELRFRDGTLYVTSALLHPGADGSVNVSGEIGAATDLRVNLEKVPVAPHLPEDWRARLSGDVNGDIVVRSARSGERTVSGDLRMVNGELKALPILDQIAEFTRTDRFRRLLLGSAEAAFETRGERTEVKRFVAESEGLLKIEGSCVIERGQIAGNFQIGVTSASLQWLPGAQERVFTDRRGGYLWTTVRVSGPVDHPKEDLSARLVAAAGGAVIEGVEGTVRDAADTLLDLAAPFLR